MHRLSHLLGDVQAGMDHAGGGRVRVVQQRREQARHRLSEGLGKPEPLERRLEAKGGTAGSSRAWAASGESSPTSSPIPTCRRSTTTTSRSTQSRSEENK